MLPLKVFTVGLSVGKLECIAGNVMVSYVIVKDLGGMLYQEWNIQVRSTRMF